MTMMSTAVDNDIKEAMKKERAWMDDDNSGSEESESGFFLEPGMFVGSGMNSSIRGDLKPPAVSPQKMHYAKQHEDDKTEATEDVTDDSTSTFNHNSFSNYLPRQSLPCASAPVKSIQEQEDEDAKVKYKQVGLGSVYDNFEDNDEYFQREKSAETDSSATAAAAAAAAPSASVPRKRPARVVRPGAVAVDPSTREVTSRNPVGRRALSATDINDVEDYVQAKMSSSGYRSNAPPSSPVRRTSPGAVAVEPFSSGRTSGRELSADDVNDVENCVQQKLSHNVHQNQAPPASLSINQSSTGGIQMTESLQVQSDHTTGSDPRSMSSLTCSMEHKLDKENAKKENAKMAKEYLWEDEEKKLANEETHPKEKRLIDQLEEIQKYQSATDNSVDYVKQQTITYRESDSPFVERVNDFSGKSKPIRGNKNKSNEDVQAISLIRVNSGSKIVIEGELVEESIIHVDPDNRSCDFDMEYRRPIAEAVDEESDEDEPAKTQQLQHAPPQQQQHITEAKVVGIDQPHHHQRNRVEPNKAECCVIL